MGRENFENTLNLEAIMYTPVLGAILKVGVLLITLVSFHIFIEISRTNKILQNIDQPYIFNHAPPSLSWTPKK